MIATCENECGTAQRWSAKRSLTRPLDPTEEGLAMHATRTCSVTDCDQPYHGLGLCRKHYNRQNYAKRAVPGGRKYPPRTFCRMADCGKPTKANRLCHTHYQRYLRTGDPLVVRPAGTTTSGEADRNWRGDDIGYGAAHLRLRKAKGPAANHACVDCGGQAAHWSYDHRDPDELMRPGPRPYAFSTKPEHYEPRCAACHPTFDAAWRKASA